MGTPWRDVPGYDGDVLTVTAAVVRNLASHSLIAVPAAGYVETAAGVFEWAGERPATDWHVHGWTVAHPWRVVGGRRCRVTLRKRRWRRADRMETCHSRPPDDLGVRSDALLVVLELWCWLDAAVGLERYLGPFPSGPARRTVQRWLARALPLALQTQHAFRHAIIERSEPRPLETLFPRGLSPPEALRSRWRDRAEVSALWRGLAFLLVGASKLGCPLAPLLAEARRRWTAPRDRFLLL